jgi:hypothetical protein
MEAWLLDASVALSARKKVQEENNPALPPSFDAADENPGDITRQLFLSEFADFDR